MKQVFISYRRADAGALADEIARSIRSVFGEAAVFIDTGDIPVGFRWAEVLDRRLEGMFGLLCVMGARWAGQAGDGRRIDDPRTTGFAARSARPSTVEFRFYPSWRIRRTCPQQVNFQRSSGGFLTWRRSHTERRPSISNS